MWRSIFASFVFLHGVIHFIGVAKVLGINNHTPITQAIAKPAASIWFLTALLFLAAAILFLLKKDIWLLLSVAAIVLSQFLILSVWKDAKLGTIPNVLILLVVILSFGSWQFEKRYRNEVQIGLQCIKQVKPSLLTEADLLPLPLPVQRYLKYAGVVNKPNVLNVKIEFVGQMRQKGKEWFPFTSEQYNFFNVPTRLFFMKAKMFGITVPGFHSYKNGKASMQIKPFGLLPMVSEKDGILNKAETVTVFNDMCLLAPATLIDKRIAWTAIDDQNARAVFTINDISITATLCFNDIGQLINFVSDDRYEIGDKKRYRFSTPVSNYQNFNGYNLPAYGEALWHYPEGAFTYGRFNIKAIKYNTE